ncbi:TadE/TadG family type IV pilus assembly protein [Pseudoduganella sp. RAF53_2]|uniref:TadE/TadG family type IV pilus assembly protein n=1 Tax=unclassified Pseudoduganella TaxID=2637179 RepID=UPI003F9CC4F6
MNARPSPRHLPRQRGGVAVEFALLALFVFFPLMLAIIEVGRYMYVYNTMQEVTRRAAREAAIRWTSTADNTTAKTLAMFNRTTVVPGASEITPGTINITYLNKAGTAVINPPTDPADNMSACNDALRTASCIYSVQVQMTNVQFTPFVANSSLFNSNSLKINMPASTVIMYAESMGFTN